MLEQPYYFLNEIVNNSPDVNIVTWTMSSICSYDCWYCRPNLRDGMNKFKDPDKCIEFFNKYSADKKQVVLSLLGGEPTLWKDLEYFVNRLPNNVFVEINSNANRTIRWWKQYHHLFNGFRLTFHPNDADVDQFYEKVAFLESTGKFIDVGIIYDNSNDQLKQKSETLFKLFDQTGLKIEARLYLLRVDAGSDFFHYTEQEMQVYNMMQFDRTVTKSPKPAYVKFEDQYIFTHRLRVTNENRFKGWSCSAGVNGIYIDEKGDIYRATCGIDGKIGNIETDHKFIEQKPQYVKCKFNYCGCGDDIVLHKKK